MCIKYVHVSVLRVCVCVDSKISGKFPINFLFNLSAVLDVDGREIENSTRAPCLTMAFLPIACSKYGRTVQVRSTRTLLVTMNDFNMPYTITFVTS